MKNAFPDGERILNVLEGNMIERFWNEFLRETGRSADTPCSESFSFGMDDRLADELLRLVLIGKKRATASSLPGYQVTNESLPEVGELSIVTDSAGVPCCVIETTAVTILPFKDITFEICRREGEDECLETWQEKHRAFFTEEGKLLGYEFSEDMYVVFEDFEVVYMK